VALTLLAAAVGLLAAPEPSPTARIATTIKDFAAAVDERRGEDACALLTPAAAAAVARSIGTLDCAQTIRAFGYRLNTAPLRVAAVRRADVVGATARIAPDQLNVPGGRTFGPGVALKRVGGDWRVAGFT
jgi:hypothetical protein